MQNAVKHLSQVKGHEEKEEEEGEQEGKESH
jgi:hypothetical protein